MSKKITTIDFIECAKKIHGNCSVNNIHLIRIKYDENILDKLSIIPNS